MKKEIIFVLSILFPNYYANASEEKSIDNSKEKIEKEIKEKSLHEKLSEKGRVTTQEAADSGRTTGGGRTAKVGKEN